MRYAREQLDELNFLERFLAKITFLWRALDEKLILAVGELPESFLERSDLVANVFGMVAIVFLVIALFFKRKRRRR